MSTGYVHIKKVNRKLRDKIYDLELEKKRLETRIRRLEKKNKEITLLTLYAMYCK